MGPVVLDLSLLLPALIGVAGSFWVYRVRRNNKRSALRTALLSELQSPELLREWPEGRDGAEPLYDPTSSIVYESASANLGLLSHREVRTVVDYYARTESLRNFLDLHSEMVVQNELGNASFDSHRTERQQNLREAIDKIEIARHRAIAAIMVAENQPVEYPSHGVNLSACTQGLVEIEPLLTEYALVEDGVFTEKGEKFFNRDLTTLSMEREGDTFERELTKPQKAREEFASLFRGWR